MLRLLVLLLLLCGPLSARADDPLAELASGSFNTVRQGVEDLAQSGNPNAAKILSALQKGQLFYLPDHTLLIQAEAGSYTNAVTGEPVSDDDSEAKAVRINNAVRSALDAALGSLRLFDLNASVRLDAAEAVFNSHEPAAIPLLDRALAKEADSAVKTRMQLARAAAVISNPDAAQDTRLAA